MRHPVVAAEFPECCDAAPAICQPVIGVDRLQADNRILQVEDSARLLALELARSARAQDVGDERVSCLGRNQIPAPVEVDRFLVFGGQFRVTVPRPLTTISTY